MGLLEQVLGDQPQRRDEYRDFINRYDKGSPYDGIDDREAVDRYREVAHKLPPDLYEESAQEAFARLSPEERREFGQYMRQQARQRNVDLRDLDGDGMDDRYEQPDHLGKVAGRMHRQQPDMLSDMLGGMLGGGGGGMLGGMLGGGGSSRSGVQRGGGGGMGDVLSNPIAKAALAGITAMAAKKMMDSRR